MVASGKQQKLKKRKAKTEGGCLPLFFLLLTYNQIKLLIAK